MRLNTLRVGIVVLFIAHDGLFHLFQHALPHVTFMDGLDVVCALLGLLLTKSLSAGKHDIHVSRAAASPQNVFTTIVPAHTATQLDALTGLPDRRHFLSVADTRRKASQSLIAVFFIDIDRFKIINDALGENFANYVLVAIAQRVVSTLPKGSCVGRVGGDEFAALVEVEDEATALFFAEQLLSAFINPIAIERRRIHCTGSIGLCLSASPRETAMHLLRDAHTAMATAKSDGRNRIAIFHKAMHAEAERDMQLRTDLRNAVDAHEFFVEYQPIYDLAATELTGFEALVRWHHPEKGAMAPDTFIPAAEESGLIIPLGLNIIQEVCRRINEYHLDHTTPISINLSVRQLLQNDLTRTIEEIFSQHNIDPEMITFEVTESIFLENLKLAREQLLELKKLGVKIAIDDFGTGYSSLSYLRELPFDVLKIDRSFIRNITHDTTSQDIVRTLLMLSGALDMTVIAEGIEEEEQRLCLTRLGCSKGQGFYFSRPLSPEAAFALVRPSSERSLSW